MNNSLRYRSNARGFTLIEAMVALLVMSFGMLAIAGFQTTLFRNSDIAKQRTEATQLAQQKMEELRAYGQVSSSTGTPHIFNYTDDVVSGAETPVPGLGVTNAIFNRTWTVTPNSSNTEKWINVKVAWTDRTGASQEVQLLSVISKFDPQDIGTLATGPGGVNVRKPKNRNLNIPYPAVTLADRTKSAFIPPPGNVTYVFDNDTGNIIGSCDGFDSSTLVEGLDIDLDACDDIDAYLLSGYVRFDTGNNPSGEEPQNASLSRYDTLPLASTTTTTTPLTLTPSNGTGGTPSMVCYSERQKVLSAGTTSAVTISSILLSGDTATVTRNNHGFVTGQTVAINATNPISYSGAFVVKSHTNNTFTYEPRPLPAEAWISGGTAQLLSRITIPESSTPPTGYTTVVSKFVSYACIVTPVNHDSNNTTPKRWWGQVTLNPNTIADDGTVWDIGNGSNQYKVCRYSADYNSSSSISNNEHPLWYRGVTGALSNQNLLVIGGNKSCPTDGPVNLLSSPVNFADDSTVAHQPTPGALSTLEPSTTTQDIEME